MDSDVLLDLIPSSIDTDDEDIREKEQKSDEERRKSLIKNVNAIEILIMNIKQKLNDNSTDSSKIVNDCRQQICKILGCNENICHQFQFLNHRFTRMTAMIAMTILLHVD